MRYRDERSSSPSLIFRPRRRLVGRVGVAAHPTVPTHTADTPPIPTRLELEKGVQAQACRHSCHPLTPRRIPEPDAGNGNRSQPDLSPPRSAQRHSSRAPHYTVSRTPPPPVHHHSHRSTVYTAGPPRSNRGRPGAAPTARTRHHHHHHPLPLPGERRWGRAWRWRWRASASACSSSSSSARAWPARSSAAAAAAGPAPTAPPPRSRSTTPTTTTPTPTRSRSTPPPRPPPPASIPPPSPPSPPAPTTPQQHAPPNPTTISSASFVLQNTKRKTCYVFSLTAAIISTWPVSICGWSRTQPARSVESHCLCSITLKANTLHLLLPFLHHYPA